MSRAVGQAPSKAGPHGNRWQLLLNLLVWTLVLVAAARPVFVEKPIERQQPVRDLMLAIDISQSMETTDFTDANGQKIDRLAAVKEVVHGFIDKRENDRLGLIVFGSGAYPQAPLTLDHASLSLLLDDTGIGMAGPNTGAAAPAQQHCQAPVAAPVDHAAGSTAAAARAPGLRPVDAGGHRHRRTDLGTGPSAFPGEPGATDYRHRPVAFHGCQ